MKIDFDAINAAALGCLESLLHSWFPAGRRNGAEFKIGGLDGSPGRSLSVNLRTGVWSDFAAGVGGSDPVSLLAAVRGCEQGAAAKELAEVLRVGGLELAPSPPKIDREEWEALPCAPDNATNAPVRHWKFGDPTHVWTYNRPDGSRVGYVCRFDVDGKKEVLPLSWCRHADGREGWRWKAFAKPRPIYNGNRLEESPMAPVLIVEGEKCADAAREALPSAVVVSWPGGCKAVRLVDWSPLKGRRVWIWPDADDAGRGAAKTIMEALRDVAAAVSILRVFGDSGWDIADAIAEGWTPDRLRAFIKAGGDPDTGPEEGFPQSVEEPGPKAPEETEVADEPESRQTPDPFRILGHADGLFFYLPASTQTVVALEAAKHRKLELLQLAPASWWETMFPGREGADWFGAANSLIQRAKRADFDASLIRGRGAWLDAGRVIYHAGDRLLVDREETVLDGIESRWTYQKGRRLDADLGGPLKSREAQQLLELCGCFQFRHSLDAKFLAGWLALAPICGALEWRPHLWLTGPAGTGKTWILDNVVRPVLGNCALYVQSVTTEAGIRQLLGCDALPVVFDEAEAEREADQRRMQAVLILARQASRESDGRIAKGTAGGQALTWHVRSTFLFSSIGIAATQRADLSRVTVLDLVPEHQRRVDRFGEALAIYKETLAKPEWAAGLRARSLALAPVIALNCARFKAAVLDHLGNQRDADQIGALLAGAFSLTSGAEISAEAAQEWCAKQDWAAFQTVETERDEARCLAHLMEANVLADLDSGSMVRTTIAELLRAVYAREWTTPAAINARAALARLGIGARRDGVDVANAHDELRKIFRETPWGQKWRDQLKRIDGALELSASAINGVSKRAVRLPLPCIPGED
jgi:putative DNA primase/helicase